MAKSVDTFIQRLGLWTDKTHVSTNVRKVQGLQKNLKLKNKLMNENEKLEDY